MLDATVAPFYLFFTVSFTVFVCYLVYSNNIRRHIFASFILFFGLSVIWVSINFAYDSYLLYELNKFDLDKDGIFSGPEERHPEQEEAMRRVISDTGRSLFYLFAAPLSAIFAFVFYVVLKIVVLFSRMTRGGSLG